MSRKWLWAFGATLGILCASEARAQVAVTGAVAGAAAGAAAGNVAGGAAAGNVGGISIDAQGVVRPNFAKDAAPDLVRRRREAALKLLPGDLVKPNPLRKVSLVRLEAALEPYVAEKRDATAAMNYLAGLQRIDYVFVLPETKDVVIAGPAEGFQADALGRVVGMTSGRPPLRLDDLMVALRAMERGGAISCSIDPAPDRFAALDRFLKQANPRVTRDQAIRRYEEMAEILGLQNVRVQGIPPETHFAQVLVEADYRMKLIALGIETVAVRGFKSHFAVAPPKARSMQRWWMSPYYEAFQTTEDRLAFRFSGQRVQLMSQEETSTPNGQRQDAAFTRVSTEKWAQMFTDKLPEIAEKSPVFAELQNAFDLAVLAALLRKEQIPDKIGWKPGLFLDAERATVATAPAPRQVPTVFNYRATNQGYVTGMVGGGVTIVPAELLREANIVVPREGAQKLGEERTKSRKEPQGNESPWWWD